MATKKLWTARVKRPGWYLLAQCKSSKKELIDRLIADDHIWSRGMDLFISKMKNKSKFRRGLAIWVEANGDN